MEPFTSITQWHHGPSAMEPSTPGTTAIIPSEIQTIYSLLLVSTDMILMIKNISCVMEAIMDSPCLLERTLSRVAL